MIKALRGLIGQIACGHAAKIPAAKTKPSNTRDFRAVSIVPSGGSCTAAKEVAHKRYLSHEAPSLPLAECTMPTGCSCKYLKTLDRRDSDRRLLGETEVNRWFAGPQRRLHATRRAKKN